MVGVVNSLSSSLANCAIQAKRIGRPVNLIVGEQELALSS
jgi:hypothetical protein